MKRFGLLLAASFLGMGGAADAATLAVFGNNPIGARYAASGNTVTYVTNTQLATAGFLNSFDAFVYTRDGSSFGSSLTTAAAANVNSFVTKNIVLFNGDFADDIPTSSNTSRLFDNALAYVLSGGAGGYIGEYTGSFAAFASNASGLSPIGLVAGTSGPSGAGLGGANGSVNVTAAGAGSSLLTGVTLPYNPGAVEFSATATGVNPASVVLAFDNGNAALIASSRASISSSAVPEPATWAMMLVGFAGVGASMRRRRSGLLRQAA